MRKRRTKQQAEKHNRAERSQTVNVSVSGRRRHEVLEPPCRRKAQVGMHSQRSRGRPERWVTLKAEVAEISAEGVELRYGRPLTHRRYCEEAGAGK